MTAPARCLCSHGKSNHTRGAGQCWNRACGCAIYRETVEPIGERCDCDGAGFDTAGMLCGTCNGAGRRSA